MSATLAQRPRGLALMFNRRRVLFTLFFTFVLGSMIGAGWKSGMASAQVRVIALGFVAMLVFGIFEQWPRTLPRWLARWVLQVAGVGVVMPIATAAIWAASTPPGAPHFWLDQERMVGFASLTFLGIFLAPWISLAAVVRQKDAFARDQALAFALERSELERQAVDARLHLLQAQVAPHFLFNTLANVQALVDSGSPQASAVLRSLVAYLRAAVPRLDEPATTLRQEVQLVRAYLELMHMRMPDRLQFGLEVDDEALGLSCPPLTLLTLVENAVRHGIDPGEDGGRIDVEVRRRGDRCAIRVADTGVGLREGGGSLGTGLRTLRERLELVFGGDARVSVSGQAPHGVVAEVDVPARSAGS